VFVNIINKNLEETKMQHDAVVEDIEKIIEEVYQVRVKTEQSEKKVLEDTFKLQKSVNDLEAHINTSIIQEKSVRKAQDKTIAEELDVLKKKVSKFVS
jgi:ABC-type phosphate transport system auxiliary subunit